MRKEFRQTLREPRMRALLLGPPVLQLIIFGFAVNLDVESCRIAWVDLDHTPASRDLRAAFVSSRHFEIAATPADEEQVQAVLDRGDVLAVVRVLPEFARNIERGETAQVQILVEGTNSNTASIVASYANQVVSEYSSRVLARKQASTLVGRTALAGGAVNVNVPALQTRARVWFNPDLKSRNYFVPGVVVNIAGLITLLLTGMAIVREREIGTIEQLMVTPIRPLELILGKTLPFAVIGLLDVVLITVAALVVFRIPFRGSVFLLLASAVLFLFSTLGTGLFISTISRTQQQALMSSFFFFMPAFMLSGFAFPIRNMPLPVQYITLLNPIRYFVEIVRGIFLKGTGAAVLWPQMLALLVFGAAVLLVSALRFHKRLD